MEYFYENLRLNDKNGNSDWYDTLKHVITSDNNAVKFEYFGKFIKLGKQEEIPLLDLNYNKLILFTYVLDINKDFKNDLLFFIKHKNLKTIYNSICKTFLGALELCKDCNKIDNITILRIKLKIFNNFFDVFRFIISNEKELNSDDNYIGTTIRHISNIIMKDLSIHMLNINEDVYQLLIMFFKNSQIFFCNFNREIIHKSYISEINILYETSREILISHIKNTINFNKDFELTFSNAVFQWLNLQCHDLNEYMRKSEAEILDFATQNYQNFFIYIKSYIINLPFFGVEFLEEKTHLFNSFLKMYMITDDYTKTDSKISMIQFYQIFLENDFKSNFSILINQFMIILVQKVGNPLICYLNSDFLCKIFLKMKRDKAISGVLDDNYYYLLDSIRKVDEELSKNVEIMTNEYILDLLNKNQKLLIIDAKMLKFIISSKSEQHLNLMKDFFAYLFSKPFEKKSLQMINEYLKTLLEFFISIDNNISLYQKFISVFSEHFFNYLLQLDPKDLKFLNNMMISLENFNKNLYAVLVGEFFKRYFVDNITELNQVKKYSTFLTLIKPFKSHKKTLIIKDNKFVFDLVIIDKELRVNFSLPILDLKKLMKSCDRYLVLYLLEFINGIGDHEKLFTIIKTLLKYNIKSSYSEFKNSLMQNLNLYFNEYIDKISKTLVKINPSENDLKYLNSSLENFIYLFKFLTENIYDRPVENLLVYLELLKLNIDLIDKISNLSLKNDHLIKIRTSFLEMYELTVFNKGLAISLISLIRQSWYYVRYTAHNILKNDKFRDIIFSLKDYLIIQIADNFHSLRQMDAEGSVNLFILLLHHFKDDFISEYSSKILILNPEIKFKIFSSLPKINCINFFHQLIKLREEEYFKIVTLKNYSGDFSSITIHSYFIMIRNILEEDKDIRLAKYANLLLDFGMDLIHINSRASELLINNGVAEYLTEFDESESHDTEDKGLISLWCFAKYSIDSLNITLDVITNNFKEICDSDEYALILKKLESYLDKIINLMIQYKHMGAVCVLNESLLKVAKLLNKSEDQYKSYRELSLYHLKEFIDKKLIVENLCSTLRRSAGIPFILTTLIKSYISNDKLSLFSHNKVVEILKWTIETLLNHFARYQTSHSDVSVHCLHILRIICDDTHIRSYANEFYNLIILKIVDGLGNDNWSIKNACMLLFSRIIRHNFLTVNKAIPTFVEYFNGKEDLKKKIIYLLEKEIQSGYNCNDCLILLTTFFSKFKKSKYVDQNDPDVKEVVNKLYSLRYKNSKLFRKVLCTAIIQISGRNSIQEINQSISCLENNNEIDFAFNMMYLHEKESKNIPKENLEKLFEENIKINNYFVCYKMIKFYTKFLKLEFGLFGNLIEINNSVIQINKVFSNLKENSKKPFYFKLIKNSLMNLLDSGKYLISEIELSNIDYYNEELVKFIFKKYSSFLIFDKYKIVKSINDDEILSRLNVNLSTKLIDYMVTNTKILELLQNNSELIQKIVIKLIDLLNESKSITKLAKRLLKILPKLILYIQDKNQNNIFSKVLEISYEFCFSFNEDKLRYASLLALDTLLSGDNSSITVESLEIIMKMFIYTLNDEHPELRNLACTIFCNFNRKLHIISFEQYDDQIYSNEFILKAVLKNFGKIKNLENFYFYLINENFYFKKENIKSNSRNKVFYYEPENKYIDNVDIKIKLMKELVDNEIRINLNRKESINENLLNLSILTMLENFVEHVTDNFELFVEIMKNHNFKDFKKFPFTLLRKFLYKYK